jgi:thiol-disulfide isomerase/thioredoxin
MTAPDRSPSAPRRPKAILIGALAVAAVAGLAGVYGMRTAERNPAAAACRPAVELAQRLAPLAQGEVAALAMATEPRSLPPLSFRDAAGREVSLGDWRGRTVLLNLWATWCVPCRKEMPALDELQAKLGGPAFEVVTVNIDTRDAEKPKAWLKENGIVRLAYYADPSAKIFQDLKAVGRAFGMPTTLLVDPQGCEVAYLAGPAEWASPDALKLIEASLAGRSG